MRAIVMSIRVVFAADNANETTTAVIGDFAVSLSRRNRRHPTLLFFLAFLPKYCEIFFPTNPTICKIAARLLFFFYETKQTVFTRSVRRSTCVRIRENFCN